MADSRLTYAFDGGFLTGAHPPDTPRATENVEDEDEDSTSTDSKSSSDSTRKQNKTQRCGDLSASVRMFSRSFLRMELDEMEMIKASEASRLESEKRRMEAEAEMTQMLLNTQLDIASFLLRTRKRKRGQEDDDDDDNDSSITARQGLLLLGLLQPNLSF